MENGLFIGLTQVLVQIPAMLVIILPIGLIGTIFLLFLMPIRIIWVILRLLKPGDKVITNKRSYTNALVFLALATYGTSEGIYALLSAGSGSISGLMIPMISFLPFIFYILFEWEIKVAYKITNKTASNNTLLRTSRSMKR